MVEVVGLAGVTVTTGVVLVRVPVTVQLDSATLALAPQLASDCGTRTGARVWATAAVASVAEASAPDSASALRKVCKDMEIPPW
jgi:hypothetical protein